MRMKSGLFKKKSETAIWKRDDVATLDGRLFVLNMSSKGGVGKSMNALNTAEELDKRGYKVGIVGIDIDSDNVPGMLGLKAKAYVDPGDWFIPVMHNNIRVISIGALLKEKSVVSKKGHEIAVIIDDIIKWTKWEDTEIIVLDMPAGISEEFKAVLKTVTRKRIIGANIVCTPNTTEDLERTIGLCLNNAVPMVGVTINMAGAVENFGDKILKADKEPYYPFGDDAPVVAYLQQKGVTWLGSVPLIDGFSGYKLPDFAMTAITKACDEIEKILGELA